MTVFRFMWNLLVLVSLISIFISVGCAPKTPPPIPELTALQREAFQTKVMQGDFKTVFSATIAVLQNEGWKIDSIEKESGIIQGSSTKRHEKYGPYGDWYNAHPEVNFTPEPGTWTRWEQVTAHIEKWGTNKVRTRLSIVKVGSLPSDTYSSGGCACLLPATVKTKAGKEESRVVDSPERYKVLFQQIQKAVFVRKGLTGEEAK